ncbi:hypothetical protein GGF32_005580 [Allomyces javanicus]|nr:hypothetical protein GGF32_005580 [Allomyces javanicus]
MPGLQLVDLTFDVLQLLMKHVYGVMDPVDRSQNIRRNDPVLRTVDKVPCGLDVPDTVLSVLVPRATSVLDDPLPQLQSLTLRSTQMSDGTFSILTRLPMMPRLKQASVCGFAPLHVSFLQMLARAAPRLQALSLIQNLIVIGDMEPIPFRALETLVMDQVRLSASLQLWPTITSLTLSILQGPHNPMHLRATILDSLMHLTKLRITTGAVIWVDQVAPTLKTVTTLVATAATVNQLAQGPTTLSNLTHLEIVGGTCTTIRIGAVRLSRDENPLDVLTLEYDPRTFPWSQVPALMPTHQLLTGRLVIEVGYTWAKYGNGNGDDDGALDLLTASLVTTTALDMVRVAEAQLIAQDPFFTITSLLR